MSRLPSKGWACQFAQVGLVSQTPRWGGEGRSPTWGTVPRGGQEGVGSGQGTKGWAAV